MHPNASPDQSTPTRNYRTTPQPLAAIDVPNALLTIKTVIAVTGLSQSSNYRLAKSGELAPARRGNRCTRWRAGDVAAWLAAQVTSSEAPQKGAPAALALILGNTQRGE